MDIIQLRTEILQDVAVFKAELDERDARRPKPDYTIGPVTERGVIQRSTIRVEELARRKEEPLPQKPKTPLPPACCLYPWPDPAGIAGGPFYPTTDLPSGVTVGGVSKSQDTGLYSYGGGLVVADTISQWLNGGTGYGGCLIAGTVADQFASTYTCAANGGTPFTLTRSADDCSYSGTNPDDGRSVVLVYIGNPNTTPITWATIADGYAWVIAAGPAGMLAPTYNSPDFQTRNDANQSSPTGTYTTTDTFVVT
jgi:hypothetical protein